MRGDECVEDGGVTMAEADQVLNSLKYSLLFTVSGLPKNIFVSNIQNISSKLKTSEEKCLKRVVYHRQCMVRKLEN